VEWGTGVEMSLPRVASASAGLYGGGLCAWGLVACTCIRGTMYLRYNIPVLGGVYLEYIEQEWILVHVQEYRIRVLCGLGVMGGGEGGGSGSGSLGRLKQLLEITAVYPQDRQKIIILPWILRK
jgi:hypothetical protein